MTAEQNVEKAIRAAAGVYDDAVWQRWAERWLDGTDRSAEAALEAVWAALSGLGPSAAAAEEACNAAEALAKAEVAAALAEAAAQAAVEAR